VPELELKSSTVALTPSKKIGNSDGNEDNRPSTISWWFSELWLSATGRFISVSFQGKPADKSGVALVLLLYILPWLSRKAAEQTGWLMCGVVTVFCQF
jgi:hypothetical protein